MPEGPSLMIVKDNLSFLAGKKITEASGYAEIDYDQIINKKITDIKVWGKHLFICLAKTNIEIHFMLFGSYLVNDKKPKINAKLHLQVGKDEVNFYVTDTRLTPDISKYDVSADIMDKNWNKAATKKKLKEMPEAMICDALMDQKIFSGVGNIIKNEVLWRAKVYPAEKCKDIPAAAITKIVIEVEKYAWEFYNQKQLGTLSKNWKAYNQETCIRCGAKIMKQKLGKTKRSSFYCSREQDPSDKNSSKSIKPIKTKKASTNGKGKKSDEKKR